MPVRNGRHIPWSVIEAERKAAAAALRADEPATGKPEPQGRVRTVRSQDIVNAVALAATGHEPTPVEEDIPFVGELEDGPDPLDADDLGDLAEELGADSEEE